MSDQAQDPEDQERGFGWYIAIAIGLVMLPVVLLFNFASFLRAIRVIEYHGLAEE